MTTEAAGLCLNGHDRAVLGRMADGRCKACAKVRGARYRQKPDYNARQKKYRDKPEYKAKRRAFLATPEGKAQMRKWNEQPAAVERRKKYALTPAGLHSASRKELRAALKRMIARLPELESVGIGLGFTPDEMKELMTIAS